MLGFAQDIATSASTECSDAIFGDPVPDADKYCWCQEWEGNGIHHVQTTSLPDLSCAGTLEGREACYTMVNADAPANIRMGPFTEINDDTNPA